MEPEQTVREFLERFDNEPAPVPQVHVPLSDVDQRFEKRQRALMLGVKILLGLVIAAAIVGYFVVKGRRAASRAHGAAAPVVDPIAAAPATLPQYLL